MNVYTMSFGASIGFKHQHPERTAKRSPHWDVTFRVWKTRDAMLKYLHKQNQKPWHYLNWTALIP